MESIGEKLRRVREERGYTLDQVARDTHITKRFILALESESFDQFPGESYLLGFLRNYANYLSLDEQETITLYRNLRLQEQPAPISELLDDSKAKRLKMGVIGLALVSVFAVGGLIIYLSSLGETTPRPAPPAAEATPDPASTATQLIQFTGDFIEQAMIRGARILVNSEGTQRSIDLVGFDEEQVAFRVNDQVITLGILDTALIDLNNNGSNDLRIITRGSAPQDTEDPGIVVRIDRFIESTEPIAPAAASAEGLAQTSQTSGPILGTTQVPTRVLPTRTLAQLPRRGAFELALTFNSPAMFRYLTDQGQTQEQFVNAGQNFRISVNNWIRLWLSNGGAVQVTVAGSLVRLGANGEVHTSMITWADLPSNQTQQIQLVPMY